MKRVLTFWAAMALICAGYTLTVMGERMAKR